MCSGTFCLLVVSLKCWGFWTCDTCFSKPSKFTLILHDPCFSLFLCSPSLPFLFSSSLSCFLFLKGTVFLSVASPEQISALKCLLRLFSLTLLIILCSHDNSPLVSHLEFISFSPPHPSQLQKKKIEARKIFLFEKCWKCFWRGSPLIRNSRLGLSSEKTLINVSNKTTAFQYHIFRNRNNHYTLCVWRYPGCCECCVLFGGREHFHNFVVIFESVLN